ncbi:hypothetical protein BMS3Abin07_00437 [bacterium BMS3Abin07]|nr:hypothetical protein BMS3Abin07_00437 [bacterium BMS3Abin07]GBE32752.1 hypothetical protein BMS3Bbin05_01671 [bacterium BMS3Bbin05]HDO22041.1 hypothetical protein [Nitrospirota bacterium]HDZ88978.1 hypothetical protein [Nitrospirota bacterium]
MDSQTVIHNWLIDFLKTRFLKDYGEIGINPEGEDIEEFGGCYPDLILKNQGMIVAIVEVETESTINDERGAYWKKLSQLGTKLILMVPENRKAKVTGLLWQHGIMQNVSVGSYSIKISMP